MIIKPPGHPYEYPDYIGQALYEFKNRDWTGKIFNDIIREYRDTFVTVPICHIKIPKGTVLFRGRKNEGDKLFARLDEIGLKSKDKVHSFGRANIPGQPVFYACTNQETVAREVTQWYINDSGRAQVLFTRGLMGKGWNRSASFITISAWHVIEDLNLGLLFSADEKKRTPGIQRSAVEREKPFIGQSENYHKSFHKILDFFSNEFGKIDVKNELEYIYSAYYAYEIYHQTNKQNPLLKLDGINYASIANDCRGENIAICESSFRRKIVFFGCKLLSFLQF